jgi:hypothetical protein
MKDKYVGYDRISSTYPLLFSISPGLSLDIPIFILDLS